MVLQRTRSGAFGCRRKILVTFRLLVIVVLATMCDRGGCAMKTGSDQYGTLEKSTQVISTSLTKHDWQRRQYVNKGHLASQSTFPQTRHSFHTGSNSGSHLNVTDSHPLSDESILDPTNTRTESLLQSTTSGLRLTNISRSWSHPQDKVPRVMMELYDMNFRTGGSSAPYEADTVRCFPAVSVQNESSAAVESDSRGYEGRPAMEGHRHTSSTFVFKIMLPKGEHVRRLMLRLHVLVRNKKSPAGLERRLRVSFVKCVPEGQRQTGCRRVVVAWKDTYLHNHSWLSFNIARALKELRNQNPATLQVDVENIFTTVGNTGELLVDSSFQDVDLQPMLLLYTSKPGARRRREKRSMTDAEWEAFEEDLEAADDDPPEIQDRNGRRASRRRRAKNSCKRKPFRVDFASIGWSDWVIAPTEYECSGKCFYPLASHLSPTKHAVIQTLMHSKSTERARRACCVPTTLGPISLLYKEDGIITFKKEYDGMVALECGCR
ncbi:bone morphogenetic protein 10 isoform X2 [Hyalella azteca]|uniref:Bone morphogenetic protein 10 isoform X2 n=1 Tax=Hyalella azteca TaxID=294128 RepID=A0A979FIW0_HYAAZ|nr:bone morphogenetic protein 10 isoform X2 [Hyalella azteca]